MAEALAILASDLAFSLAEEQLINETRAVRGLWADMRHQLIVGQFGDVAAGLAAEVTDAELAQISLMKSGRYSVTFPLRLGLRVADPDLDIPEFAAAADRLGLLFQIIDDLMDLRPSDESGKDQFLDDQGHKRRYSDAVIAAHVRAGEGPARTLTRFVHAELAQVRGELDRLTANPAVGAALIGEFTRLAERAAGEPAPAASGAA
jgi:geranylgeranyl pyrophosphate synthase